MIDERKFSDEKGERTDLLSNLVNANDEFLEDGEQKLGETELIGRRSSHDLLSHSFTHPTFRKHFHILRGWTRCEDTLTADHRSSVDPSGVTDIWKYPLLRPEHACGASRTARRIVPAHSRRSPRRPPTGEGIRLLSLESLDLTTRHRLTKTSRDLTESRRTCLGVKHRLFRRLNSRRYSTLYETLRMFPIVSSGHADSGVSIKGSLVMIPGACHSKVQCRGYLSRRRKRSRWDDRAPDPCWDQDRDRHRWTSLQP
jgi:hypothetical protein